MSMACMPSAVCLLQYDVVGAVCAMVGASACIDRRGACYRPPWRHQALRFDQGAALPTYAKRAHDAMIGDVAMREELRQITSPA